MSKHLQLRMLYENRAIEKKTYIEESYKLHIALFDYCSILKSTNISEIRITANGVAAAFHDPRVTMLCPEGDIRVAPIEALNFGDYEHGEVQMVRRIIDQLGGRRARVFDIGANAGFYSLAISSYFAGIEGVAFEPVPKTYTLLNQNLAMNGISGIVSRNLGLSDKHGELTFYTYPNQSGAASMAHNLDGREAVEIRCPVVTLDEYCAGDTKFPDFIKCDVEGGELSVFKGGKGVLRNGRPAIFTEMLRKWCAKFGYHPNDIIGFLGGMGYDCFTLVNNGLKECGMVDEETKETNYFFLHRDMHKSVITSVVH